MPARAALLACGLLLFVSGAALAQGGYELAWNTVDGGGGALLGGAYTLAGTIGQTDAATLSFGPYSLLGGFWGGPRASLRQIYLPIVLKGY